MKLNKLLAILSTDVSQKKSQSVYKLYTRTGLYSLQISYHRTRGRRQAPLMATACALSPDYNLK
jgi:hypothetical protein